MNGDGKLSVADLVAVQQFLLGNGTLKTPSNGDLCEDGAIDVFDMVEMRKYLLSQA